MLGKWGTNPYSIGKILTGYNVKYSLIKKQHKLRTKKNKVYIISFWNRGGLFNGVHTIAVKVQDKKNILAYNDGALGAPLHKRVSSFDELLKEREFIIGYQINKRG